MDVSFCIPAHNEAAHLPSTLAAIHVAAAGMAYEIVVADDASTDGTGGVAGAGGARVVRHERRQIAASRNAAGGAATGAVLIFVDADTRVTPGAVREALEAMRAGAVGGGGPVTFDGAVPRYAAVGLPIILAVFRWLRLSGGAFMFCTRSAFDASGGWDESLFAGEEIEFAKALKGQGRFVVVRTPVVTSGRKLRLHGPGELLGLLWRLVWSRGRLVRSRDGLDLWYGPRPVDPDTPR